MNIFNIQQRWMMMSALLALLVTFVFIFAISQWRSDWLLTHQTITAPAVVQVADGTKTINTIPDQHLFGKMFEKGDVPITNLQFHVTGIVKMEGDRNSAFSKAYISISGQPSKIYQIGDTMPYGVKVYDITEDAVILEHDGRLEKLPLPREKLQFKPRLVEGQ